MWVEWDVRDDLLNSETKGNEMKRKEQLPTVTETNRLDDGSSLKIEHPAFGTVVVTNPRGGRSRMFGSRVLHDSRITLSIHKAHMTRDLSHDWLSADETVLELEFTETQWAQFVASEGRGCGTPCTFKYLPKGYNGLEIVPEISGDPDVRPEYHKELGDAVLRELASISDSKAVLYEALESGKINKATLRQAITALDNASYRLAGTAQFIAKSFKDHMEEATTEAIMNVEGYAQKYARDLGLEVLKKTAERLDLLPTAGSP